MTKLEQKVMAGVAAVYIARRLKSPRALKAYTLFLSCVGILFFASVPNVLANFAHVGSTGLPAIGLFLFTAVMKTTAVVQIALVLGVVALVSLARDVVSSSVRQQFA